MDLKAKRHQLIIKTKLTIEERERCFAIFAETFCGEPMFRYMLEGRRDLREDTLWIAERKFRCMESYYQMYTNEGPIRGFAWWLSPTTTPKVTLWQQLRAGFAGVPFRFGPRIFKKMLDCSAHEKRILEEAAQKGPCWILDVIATDPAYQKQGLGRQFIQMIFEKADASGTDCYVLTHNERNAAFYEKSGFAMEVEEAVCSGGPTAYGLRRLPNPS